MYNIQRQIMQAVKANDLTSMGLNPQFLFTHRQDVQMFGTGRVRREMGRCPNVCVISWEIVHDTRWAPAKLVKCANSITLRLI